MSATLRTSVGELAITGESYLRLPARGNWVAMVQLHSKVAPALGETATLAIMPEAKEGQPPPSPHTFVGTVRHARVVPGSQTLVVRVVGGAGRLFTSTPPSELVAQVTPLPAGLVLASMVSAAGERLAPGVETALDAYELPRWHRAGGISARDAIDLLVYDLATASGDDLGWRTLPDGSIWAGVETWPDASGSYYYVDQDPDDGVMIYAPSGAPLRPGTTVQGERAVEVIYTLSSPEVRARVRHLVPSDPPALPPQGAADVYRTSYSATIEAQHDDGTLDLVCDDARIGELLSVPFRTAGPGLAVAFERGQRVRVRFENASPRGAYACDVDQDEDADKALALVSDACGYLSGVAPAGGGPVVLSWSATQTGAVGEAAISIVGPGHKYLKGRSA